MANVIKGGGSRRDLEREPRDPREAKDPPRDEGSSSRAKALLAEAQRSAQAIIEQARQQAAENVREAAHLGQQEGFSQAEHMREQISGLEQRMLKEVESEVVRTALKIAEQLLTAELHHREDAMVDLAVTALGHASDAREVFLRVNPKQAEILRQHRHRLVDALSMAKDVDVREDKKVAAGGVLIQTESGVIDATLETQLAEIARVLGA